MPFLAATRATDGVIAEMQAALESGALCSRGDVDKLGYVDQRFHRLLRQACGNDLIETCGRGDRGDDRSSANDTARSDRTINPGAHAILDAICSGDSHAAEQAVVDRIESVRKAIASLKDGR
jgi:DNA-binding GntR family transcriptional regulator